MKKRELDLNNVVVDIVTADATYTGMQSTVTALSDFDLALFWAPEGAEDDTVPFIGVPTEKILNIKIWPNRELDELDKAEAEAEEAANRDLDGGDDLHGYGLPDAEDD